MIDEQGYKWNRHDVRTTDEENAPIVDEESGDERNIRSFIVQTDSTKESDPKEVLAYHSKTIQDTLFKDGWVLDRELTIESLKDGFYTITAVSKPAVKHGSIIGATNDTPMNAAKALQENR